MSEYRLLGALGLFVAFMVSLSLLAATDHNHPMEELRGTGLTDEDLQTLGFATDENFSLPLNPAFPQVDQCDIIFDEIECLPPPEEAADPGFFERLTEPVGAFFDATIGRLALAVQQATVPVKAIIITMAWDLPVFTTHPLLMVVRFLFVLPILIIGSFFVFRVLLNLIPLRGGGF